MRKEARQKPIICCLCAYPIPGQPSSAGGLVVWRPTTSNHQSTPPTKATTVRVTRQTLEGALGAEGYHAELVDCRVLFVVNCLRCVKPCLDHLSVVQNRPFDFWVS